MAQRGRPTKVKQVNSNFKVELNLVKIKELKQRQLQKELEKRNFFRIFRHINN